VLSDENVFASAIAQVLVLAAIPSHYLLGLLLLRAIRDARIGDKSLASPARAGASRTPPWWSFLQRPVARRAR
jgi:hypothetical protein